MSLSDEQKRIRSGGIGASETAAILELSPFSSPIDVWLEKTGRAKERPETDEQWLGSMLEQPLRELYRERTGRTSYQVGETYTHPKFPHVLASPDGFVSGSELMTLCEDGGTELKAVSSFMAHHWEGGTVPDYVDVQCRQNMAVLGREWWDVVALIDSTTLLIQRIERDRETEDAICEAVEDFWETHIAADVAPAAQTPDEARVALRARFPFKATEKAARHIAPEDEDMVWQAARWLRAAKEESERADLVVAQLENAFIEYIGGDYGIKSGWGSFLHYPRAGHVGWKEIAHELAGGSVPAGLIEKHRGAATRVPRFYPFTPKGKRR